MDMSHQRHVEDLLMNYLVKQSQTLHSGRG